MLSDDEYLKQGEAGLERYVRSVEAIIKMQPASVRSGLQGFFDGPVGQQFMVAPASTRRRFHNAYPHGLVDHSLRVVKNVIAIAKAVWPDRWPAHKLALVGLLHDVGKAGTPGRPFYVRTTEAWKDRKGEYWEIDQDVWAPNAEIGIWTLLKSGVELGYDEIQAIRLNDGMGPAGNKEYSFHETPLALVLHWSDHAAMRQEKELDV